ncbi:hypothetical protein Bca52824_067569 [Brassica carinata]|uniref:Pectinesterase n=1 Tax=Brassica carinata TaxID=52824 RepID=A0A8X7UC00_BRACI|nr:hypothetical protein Bca52824_067569 [Brassica carinata]
MHPWLKLVLCSRLSLCLFSIFSHCQALTLEALCESTPHPPVCKSVLPVGSPGSVSGFASIVILKSLEASKHLLASLDQHHPTSGPLDDCQSLAGLTVDHLTRVNVIEETALGTSEVNDLLTLLSAAITNYETCLGSFHDATGESSENFVKDHHDILTRVSDGIKLISVSLALSKEAWPIASDASVTKPPPRILTEDEKKSSSPEVSYVKVTKRERMIYERVKVLGRKLLQSSPGGNGGLKVAKSVVVNPNGINGDAYKTINDAIAAAPTKAESENGYFVIYVVAEVYEEYVTVPSNKSYVMIVGDGIDKTIITGNRNVVDAVIGRGFMAANITVRNTAGPTKHQAVAVRNSADMSAFYKCSFEGYQDTECDIYGTVDFIFGNAATVLQNCNIIPRLPLQGQFNTITAQGRSDPNQNTDFDTEFNFSVKTYLGRPWKEYSRTVYLKNFMDGFIDAKGWNEWMGDFALQTLYYAEFMNTGPGSETANRVNWPGYHVINETEAVWFTVSNFIVGDYWLPSMGVPYTGGLM